MKLNLKKIIKEGISTLVVLVLLSNILSYIRSPKLDTIHLPELSLKRINQQDFHFKNRKKEPLLIYFWATWCSVCTLQSPVIDALAKDLQVVGIAVRSGSNPTLKNYMEKNQYTFPIVNDQDGTWSRHFKVSHFPTLFLYDSNNQLHFVDVGYTSTLGLKARLFLMEEFF